MPMSDGYAMKGDEVDLVSSHQRLLIGTALRTTGPILELGVGWYSTPLLHEVAEAQKRMVITVDNNEDWLAQFRPLESGWHRLRKVGWWGDLLRVLPDMLSQVGLVFADQGQPTEREYTTRALLQAELGDVFVFHDTEEGFAYGYDRVLGARNKDGDRAGGMFKFQWEDRCHESCWTTVASNRMDVTGWFKPLPKVEMSTEVT